MGTQSWCEGPGGGEGEQWPYSPHCREGLICPTAPQNPGGLGSFWCGVKLEAAPSLLGGHTNVGKGMEQPGVWGQVRVTPAPALHPAAVSPAASVDGEGKPHFLTPTCPGVSAPHLYPSWLSPSGSGCPCHATALGVLWQCPGWGTAPCMDPRTDPSPSQSPHGGSANQPIPCCHLALPPSCSIHQ